MSVLTYTAEEVAKLKADNAELLTLVNDIDLHMRRMWDQRSLPVSCWPTEFIRRVDEAQIKHKTHSAHIHTRTTA